MPLLGKTVFVVEDQFLIAQDLRAVIERARGTVLGPASSRKDAMPIARDGEMDAAILGIQLDDGTCVEIARILKGRDIPYVVVTGYNRDAIPPELRDAPFLAKPVRREELIQAIAGLRAGQGG